MTVRFYSSTAQETTLVGSITGANTTMTVTAVTGFPSSTPYTLAVDYNTASEELVTVTGTSGTLLTITRGSDGTGAISHNAGAKVRHVSSARDFADSRSHENASTDVHGVGPGAAIVSTTATQTLTNKTLTAPVINNGVFNNIPLGAWTSFTPTIQGDGGVPISGTAPSTNAGRYSKIGRVVQLHMDFQGNAGVVVPGGATGIITWNVPGTIAPANPSGSGFVTGNFLLNAIFALVPGASVYTNGYTGFRGLFPNPSAFEFFTGDEVTSGVIVSHDISYEAAS